MNFKEEIFNEESSSNNFPVLSDFKIKVCPFENFPNNGSENRYHIPKPSYFSSNKNK